MVENGAEDNRAIRPDVLAYPSATSARFLLLITAVLTAGAFAGIWLHNRLLGRSWLLAELACYNRTHPAGRPAPTTAEILRRFDAYRACWWPAQARRGLFAVGSTVALMVLGMAVVIVAQVMISRRRPGRDMTELFDGSAAYLGRLGRTVGVRSAVTFMVGPPDQRDAFTYGAFGRYRIQLPRGLTARWRIPTIFEPVVLHELAHIRHRDVTWGWFARAAWYVVIPLLFVPLAVEAYYRDWAYVRDYSWRLLLLAITTQLLIREFLRTREIDADLRAVQVSRRPNDIEVILGGNMTRPQTGTGLLNFHPRPSQRLAAIRVPDSTVCVTVLDGFTAGLLATLASAVIEDAAQSLLEGVNNSIARSEVISTGLSNAILGVAVGGALLRWILVNRVAGKRTRVAGPAVGVGIGILAGTVASLALTATGSIGGVRHPWVLVVPVLAGIGATFYSAGVAEIWGDGTPRALGPRTSWIGYCTLATLVFWTTGWVSSQAMSALDNVATAGGGHLWSYIRDNFVLAVPTWTYVVAVAFVGVTVAVLFCRNPAGTPPLWLVENRSSAGWPIGRKDLRAATAVIMAVLAACGIAAILSAEASSRGGPALEILIISIAISVGVCAALAVAMTSGRRGYAVALPAAMVSCAVAVASSAVVGSLLRLPFRLERLPSVALPALALSAFAAVLCAPLSALRPQSRGHARPL